MRGTFNRRKATVAAATFFAMVARMVAPAWMVPALMVNVDWTGNSGFAWSLAAAGSIVAAALFFEASIHAPGWLLRFALVVGSLFLIFCNVLVAFDNATHKSDHRSDDRRAIIADAQKARSQRSQWANGRAEAATIAGETPAAKYEADIQQAIALDSRRWQATGECNPLQITASQSRDFCSNIAELRGRLEAARRRDELDRLIRDLDSKTAGAEVPASADPFADNLANVLGILGMTFTAEQRRSLTASKDVTRAIALELIAGFAPTAWLLVINGMLAAFRSRPAPIERRVSEPKRSAIVENSHNSPEPVVAMDDPFHAFVAHALEDAAGSKIAAGEPWQLWLSYCAEHNLPAGSQKAFGQKMKARFAWEANNNRPRYLNVKLKDTAPAIRLAVSNAAPSSRLGVMARQTGASVAAGSTA